MKHSLFPIILLALTACTDDDNVTTGAPQIEVQPTGSVLMGDSVYVNVNVSDAQGVALSTLKGTMRYGAETVSTQTLRTREPGTYTLALYAPVFKDIPDGEAAIDLTLTNIGMGQAHTTATIPVSRPRYQQLTLTTSDGATATMLPSVSDPYLYTATISSADKTVRARISAKAAGANAMEQTFALSSDGHVTQGAGDYIEFVAQRAGDIEVQFNTLTYAYSPQFDPTAVQSIEVVIDDDTQSLEDNFVQGATIQFAGTMAQKIASGEYYVDPDYFTLQPDGSYTFAAMSDKYHVECDNANGGMRVWRLGNGDKGAAKLTDDGHGAIWMIGNGGFMKPIYQVAGGNAWWTETNTSLCLPEVADKVYRLTLTIGKQLRADDIDFKFFGQCGWGTEFKGTGHSHILTSTTTSVFYVRDDGNIKLQDGVTLQDGDTYVFTIDLTAGVDKGVLTVVKQ